MTPVISPWVFYLMPVCENVGFVSIIFAVIFGGIAAACAISYFCELDHYKPSEDKLKWYKLYSKKFVVVTLVLVLIACLIPSEETLTKMIIAQNVTFERVETATDIVTTVYNDIMNLFGAANG